MTWWAVPFVVGLVAAAGFVLACLVAIAVGVAQGLGDRARDRRAARRQWRP